MARRISIRELRNSTAAVVADLEAGEKLTGGRSPTSSRRLRRHDTWIAATAMYHDAAVVTRDADFSSFEEVQVLRV